jgi:hypothetical protein
MADEAVLLLLDSEEEEEGATALDVILLPLLLVSLLLLAAVSHAVPSNPDLQTHDASSSSFPSSPFTTATQNPPPLQGLLAPPGHFKLQALPVHPGRQLS